MFVVVHDIFISDIWFSVVVMVVAGVVCGLCIGWSYGVVTEQAAYRSWILFNVSFVVMLFALGAASVLVFEPTTTIAFLIEEDEPPGDLIAQALPTTLAFTAVAAVAISILFGRTWAHFGAVLVTSIVLVALLGLNVSVIGLVDIPTDSLYLIAELFGLILLLDLVLAVVFVILERKTLSATEAPSERQSLP